MRKFAALFSALGVLAFAGSASAASISIVGSNTPGVNTYDIVLSFTTGEAVAGIATSVTTTGIYTGVVTETTPPAFGVAIPGPFATNGATGVAGSWGGASSAGPVAGGTFTLGTVQITVAAGQSIDPFFTLADGVVTVSSGFVPTTFSGVTVIPEPTTAALLGLGIMGLVLAGRRSRA